MKIKECREFYRSIVENANEAILVLQDEFIVYANPKTSRILELPLDDIIERPFIKFIHPDDRHLIVERYHKRLKGEPLPETYTFRVTTKSRNVLILLASAKTIEWEGKRAVFYILLDITLWKDLGSNVDFLQKGKEISLV